ncbi:hypothetical protein PAHAL_6G149500 [Panicum hallii]|uniref:Uncharacterized protein n=1 Tax=Panicum hallii TaxID=206008 RepID=A0A2T8IG90_9POAL|nr:hypothetical protein PAHAL_6G149500 [Panicum hallii]
MAIRFWKAVGVRMQWLIPWWFGDANSTFGCSNVLLRFWRTIDGTLAVEGTPILQADATNSEKIVLPSKPKGEERLPPNIVVPESDLHLRRLWGNPREDTPTRKYLLALTMGYNERANVNATVQKFSENFDVVLFHYDGRTTEWDEFEWSKKTVHASARGQTKWWYGKRFLHPSIVAPYDYDLVVETFDAEEYLKIVRKHGLAISQPGLNTTSPPPHHHHHPPPKPFFDITVRRNGSEMHLSTLRSAEAKCRRRPCSGFVEVMAPVFSQEAWACVRHMIQNDLVHGHGLDWDLWRYVDKRAGTACVQDPEEQIGVVDAQYVAHHAVVTLGTKRGSLANVTARQKAEFNTFKTRMRNAERAQAAALLAAPEAT